MSIAFIILFFALLIWIKAFLSMTNLTVRPAVFRSPIGVLPFSPRHYRRWACSRSATAPMELWPWAFCLSSSEWALWVQIPKWNWSTYDLTQIKTIFDKTLSSRILICVYIIFTLIITQIQHEGIDRIRTTRECLRNGRRTWRADFRRETIG